MRARALACAGLGLLLGPLVRPAPAGDGATSERGRQAQTAMATIIHLTSDGNEVLRGNGFLVGADGILVTNYHVVHEAQRLQIQLANGDVYDQVLVRGLDPAADAAALKIPAFGAPFVALSRRPPPEAGQAVEVVPRAQAGGGPTAPLSVIGRHELVPGLDFLSIGLALDASTKGAPVLDASGECVGLTTLAYRAGAGHGVFVAVSRLVDLLGQDLNRPLELVDWSAGREAETALRAESARVGLERHLPDVAIRKEKSLVRRLEMALQFDPTDLQAKTLLARAYIQQRDYARASTQIAEILARDADSVPVLSLKGDLLHHTGDYDGARELYRRVVDAGYQPPHKYDKDLQGVRVAEALHDHFLAACSGPIVAGREELSYWPFLMSDRLSVAYPSIRRVRVKSDQKAGQTAYELGFEFVSEVPNPDKTVLKTDLDLRLTDREARDNFCAYLRKRGVPVIEEK